jgi:NTE family protein
VSTNLSTSDLHIHRRGPLWEAVRASGSLPTILPPFIDHDGHVLVDGGVLDNLPVTIMQSIKRGPNIVVALDALNEHWFSDARYHQVRSRGALLRDIALRRTPEENFPSIFETTQRSMVVTSRMASRGIDDASNILLTPPRLPGMQILDWHRGRELASIAEQATHDFIAANPDRFKTILPL